MAPTDLRICEITYQPLHTLKLSRLAERRGSRTIFFLHSHSVQPFLELRNISTLEVRGEASRGPLSTFTSVQCLRICSNAIFSDGARLIATLPPCLRELSVPEIHCSASTKFYKLKDFASIDIGATQNSESVRLCNCELTADCVDDLQARFARCGVKFIVTAALG